MLSMQQNINYLMQQTPNKNVLNISEATVVSNIPSKISRKMFFPTTFLQYVKYVCKEISSYKTQQQIYVAQMLLQEQEM